VLYIPVSSGWSEYFTKIQTMIAGGNAPDVSQIAIEGIQMFTSMGLALPMDSYMKAHPDVVGDALTDINPNLEKPFIIGGKTYGLVADWNNVVMHFNTKLLSDAGLSVPAETWTMQDYLNYCKALTKTVNGKKQFGTSIPNSYFQTEGILYANGASILNDDMTKCTLNSPQAVQIFQMYQDLVLKYKYAPYPDPKVDSIQQLAIGQTAMGAWGRWPVAEYVQDNFKDVAIQLLPNFQSAGSNQKVVFGSGAICALKSTSHPDEAIKFAIWTASQYFEKNYYGTGSIPTRKSVADEVIPQAGVPQNSDLFYKTASYATAVQAPSQYANIQTIFDKYMSEILSSPVDVKTELDKATDEINNVLANQ
jgi:ABC-type glycerol-3-phosphate transport system substrate-binding protein